MIVNPPVGVGVMTTLGDLPYGGVAGVTSRLAGNISATRKFLTQTGTGSASAAPAWNVIAAGDLPTGIDATKIGAGLVSNTKFGYLLNVTSDIQAQINSISGGGISSLTGDVTGTGPGAAATTIANGVVSLAKMANMATASLIYRKTAGSGVPEVQTLATLKTDLGLTGTNSGDQTTITGNAGTATALQNARTIGGISFDGTANITVASATGGFTVSGGALALGANDLTMTGSLGATGARLTKGWFTDLQVTNAIAGSITGNAATVTTNANLTGDITSVGNATTLTNAPVIAKVLTGYVSGAGTVSATDSILQAFQKLNGNDALKANIASPTFTGTVVIPTPFTLGAVSVTATGTELNYSAGVTSAIQTQLNAKGVGDMVLVSVQTVTGTKTFSDTKLLLRNVAGTFNGSFVNTNTADRIYTLKDAAGTLAFTSDITGTNSGTNTGDQTITLTGAVTGSGTGTFATTIATPGTLTVSSTNTTATAHTHAITSNSAPGAAASILATDSSGIIGATGTRIVKGWFTDLTVTNAIAGSITGNAATVTTNANLTGHITSVGNAAVLGSFTFAQINTAVSDADVARTDAANTFTGIQTMTSPALTTPAISGLATGSGVSALATASTIATRDANANLLANNWLGGYSTTATAAGTTTLTVGSTYAQFFTGSTTQIVTLPVVSTLAIGHQFLIVNNSTGLVTVNSSGSNAVIILAGSTSALITCILITGTSAASWSVSYYGDVIATGKKLTVSNTLTLTATDGSTLAIGSGGMLGSNAYTSTAYAPLASPTFTGTVTIPTPFTIGAVSMTATGTQLNYLAAATGTTGTTSTNLVFSTSPTLTTPNIGAATATSINGNTFTTGTYTITGTAAKTLSFTNTLTLSGTDGTTMTFPSTSATIARTDAANTFTGVQTMTSPALTTPAITGLATGSGVASAATASTLSARDVNANLLANNFLEGYTTTATAAGTTTLTVGSAYAQFFTGSSTQTVTLPVASTLASGHHFLLVNNSTGAITVNSSGGNAVQVMVGLSVAVVTCILASGTSAASWSVSYTPAFTNSNTISTAVLRDGFGNFSAGTITASLTGNASGSSGSCTGNAATATALATARAINGVNFDGTAPITVTAASGTLTGATLNASVTASSLTSVGTLTGGSTGAGFTLALTTSTVTGILPAAQMPALTGDITTSAGAVATTIGASKVTNAMLAGSIAYSKLSLTGAILNADLAGSIAATKLVGTDIATVGTVTTGTWSATAIGVTKGGTGLTSTTINQLLYSSSTSTIAGLATANNAVLVTSSGGIPSLAATGSSLQVSSSVLNTIQDIRTTASPTFGALTVNGTVNYGPGVTGSIPGVFGRDLVAGYSILAMQPQSGTNVHMSFHVIPKGTGQAGNIAQFLIYGTDAIADGSNVELCAFRATGTSFFLATAKEGTATLRQLILSCGGASSTPTNTTQLVLKTDGSIQMGGYGAGTATFDASGNLTSRLNLRLKGYTVATLPAGTQGDTAFCTDLLAPGFLVAAVGGGAVVGPVFYNGTAWVAY